MKKVEVRKIIRDMVEIYEKLDSVYDFHFNLGGKYMIIEITGVIPKESYGRTDFAYIAHVLTCIDSIVYHVADIEMLSSEEFDNISSLLNDIDRIDSIEFHKRVSKYKRGEVKKQILRIRKLIGSCRNK